MAAWCHFWRKVNGWMTDRAQEIAEGARLARRAVELGRDDAVALTRGGHALAHLAGDLDGGIALIDRALVLNPNLASAWFLGGFLRVWNGEPDGAIEHFARAMRLSPLDPEMYRMQAGMAVAHLFAGRFDTASSWAEKAFRDLPSFLMVGRHHRGEPCACGPTDEAQRAIEPFAPARSHAPPLQPWGLAPHPPTDRSRDVRRWPATSGVAGMSTKLGGSSRRHRLSPAVSLDVIPTVTKSAFGGRRKAFRRCHRQSPTIQDVLRSAASDPRSTGEDVAHAKTNMSLDDTTPPGRPGTDELVPSRYALRVGEIDVLVISDGVLSLPPRRWPPMPTRPPGRPGWTTCSCRRTSSTGR